MLTDRQQAALYFGRKRRRVFAGSPVNMSLPVVSGTAQSGQTLSTTDGEWLHGGSSITGFTYQWNADGSAIGGATASSYELTDDEIGAVITVTVTATDDEGSTAATSVPTEEVIAA